MIGNRNKPNNTPAITIVEECNNAETGDGADIALSNHEEKGNWALLVKITIDNEKQTIVT